MLALPQSFEQFGMLTPEETAAIFDESLAATMAWLPCPGGGIIQYGSVYHETAEGIAGGAAAAGWNQRPLTAFWTPASWITLDSNEIWLEADWQYEFMAMSVGYYPGLFRLELVQGTGSQRYPNGVMRLTSPTIYVAAAEQVVAVLHGEYAPDHDSWWWLRQYHQNAHTSGLGAGFSAGMPNYHAFLNVWRRELTL